MSIRQAVALACLLAGIAAGSSPAQAAEPYKPEAPALAPNLEGQLDRPLRYRPDGADFVIDDGREFFNRPLYGGNTAFRVDGGDRPEFSLYLPGRGGNLRLGLRTAAGTLWLHEARRVQARYRPGELHYDIGDDLLGPHGRLKVAAVAYAATESLGVEVRGESLPAGAELVFAFGPGNGQRGRRDGDIGTERVPIGEFFQFTPAFARGARFDVSAQGFTVSTPKATISATASVPARVRTAAASHWNTLPALLASPEAADENVALGSVPLGAQPVHLALQVIAREQPKEPQVYREVGAADDQKGPRAPLPRFTPAELAQRFADATRHFTRVRNQVRIDTPDPYLNAAMGALNVAADAVWDDSQQAIMHGAVAWRSRLLGWRGPYALDALGWHDRFRRNADGWTAQQNTAPVPASVPPPEQATNLARNRAGMHSNGNLTQSHYDMNIGFVDALLRHLLWTGDLDYARAAWPVLERHLAWERRLFRREFGPSKLPLYDAYAAIWASDDLYYNGGGVTHTSAYNAWHNAMAARIARLIGKDAAPYEAEAAAIQRGMREQLWMPGRGAFAEYRDSLGEKLLHPSYALWSFYHTLDSQVPTRLEAARMAADLDRHLRPLPVRGPGVPADRPYAVLPTSDWMPYTWSINNVVMSENLHTALAYWQADRAESAYALAKSALLASLYMGISPGNIGSMNYLDVYRRESQRDFADGSGVMSRALVEGLFGVRPDALAGVLAVRPGLPRDWNHARLEHPDVGIAYRRDGNRETWQVSQPASAAAPRFRQLALQVPARTANVASVSVNGQPARWQAEADAVGAPRLLVDVPLAAQATIEIAWRGDPIDAARATPAGTVPRDGFRQVRQGDFLWWTAVPAPAASAASAASSASATAATAATSAACTLAGPGWTSGAPVQPRHVPLAGAFNDSVTELFKPFKYLSPRSPHVTLALPAQGTGAWAGHVNDLPKLDDAGLRALRGTLRLPNGLTFATPPAGANVAFVSQWSNYPREITVPLAGQGSRAFLLMAGSTNHMQSRVDNGEIVVRYTDGTRTRTPLRNPDNWWPSERDYFLDDYQFRLCGTLPVRVDLKTARISVPDPATFKGAGRETIDGGAATVLPVPLDRSKTLHSVTVRALANDVVIGLMGLTLDP
ncbi:DUF4450 domain-containing protein [Pseudoduganella albidiflava]|uniref:DUF4450 domain-containing protein n=1 Tax=Pseudoduganella albidiflava TaxID=321983 RepID=A0A411X2V6_9BURK|nr:DUF4450 domain-containing protein [Pseudoduganella albidiflava]QBI03213.1 DUF4450 domain-containing protein [Pseudoduganella albidiflava]GGY64295.1 hypothetical protein GCM10007387_53330 [Pseudoduganella albidiflava]